MRAASVPENHCTAIFGIMTFLFGTDETLSKIKMQLIDVFELQENYVFFRNDHRIYYKV